MSESNSPNNHSGSPLQDDLPPKASSNERSSKRSADTPHHNDDGMCLIVFVQYTPYLSILIISPRIPIPRPPIHLKPLNGQFKANHRWLSLRPSTIQHWFFGRLSLATGCKFCLLCGESFDFGHRRKDKEKYSRSGRFMTKRKDQSAIAAAAVAAENQEDEGRKRKQNPI